MKLAIYDLDRTITRIGTYTPFLVFAARRRAPWRLLLLPIWLVLMIGYIIGIYDRKALKERGFLLLLGRHVGKSEMASLAEAYAAHVLTTNIYPAALDLIAADREAGHHLVLATASPDYYAIPLGRLLGMDTVIATVQARQNEGDYHWRIASPNCYGKDKLVMIEQWLGEAGLAGPALDASFYTDSSSDMPTLRWSTQPVAVNPSRKLRRLAAQFNWTQKNLAR